MTDPSDAPAIRGDLVTRTLAERATRPVSAAEALEAVRKATAPTPKKRPPAKAQPSQEEADPVRDALLALADGAVVLKRTAVDRRDVFAAVWRAHAARARVDRDLGLAVAAARLVTAADAVPAGHLFAVEVALGTTRCAAWIDTSTGAVIATATPPAVYLVT